MYLLGSVMFLVFAIVWTIFGSSEVQWWDTYWQYEAKMEYRKLGTDDTTNAARILEEEFPFY